MIETLTGIKVVSFTRAAAGISCAKLLAEYGAEVIFVEPVKGVALRHLKYFEFYINNQKSVPVNLRDPKGMEFLHRLLADADVFISNYRLKALKNMKLDYESLCEKYPRLVHATVTGYGPNGPMKDAPGFDITAFWARAGIINDVMDRDSDPLIAPAGMGDVDTGKSLALGIVSALFAREKTGKGMKVYSSLYAQGLYLNHAQIIDQQYGMKYPKTRKDPGRAMKNSFKCKDGWVQAMTLDFDKDFNHFLEAIGRKDLIGDPRWTCMADTEGEKAIELTAIFDEAFAKLTVEEAVRNFEAYDMAISAYYPGLFSVTDEQAEANGYYQDITREDGKKIRIPASPVKFGDDAPCARTDVTVFGGATREIMKRYGYSGEEIQSYIDDGIVISAD
ncbi:MAG: CoA transferase [Lachnospiraceae bacterium]|nr:CoA transferase [Lachnospiraceae bacterium]